VLRFLPKIVSTDVDFLLYTKYYQGGSGVDVRIIVFEYFLRKGNAMVRIRFFCVTLQISSRPVGTFRSLEVETLPVVSGVV
jgi:hypothetical protein